MDYLTYASRLTYLEELLGAGKVTSPSIIAEKWDCSEKTVRNMINRLREKGLKIKYCRTSKRYFLKNV